MKADLLKEPYNKYIDEKISKSLPSEHCVHATTAHQRVACIRRLAWLGWILGFVLNIVFSAIGGWSPPPPPPPLQSRPRWQQPPGSQEAANVMLGMDSGGHNNDLHPLLLLHAELPAAIFQGEQRLQTKSAVYFEFWQDLFFLQISDKSEKCSS